MSDMWAAESPHRVVQANTDTTAAVYEWADDTWHGHVELRDGTVIVGPHPLRMDDITDKSMIGVLGRMTGTFPAAWGDAR